jgi:methyltransferase-like protein
VSTGYPQQGGLCHNSPHCKSPSRIVTNIEVHMPEEFSYDALPYPSYTFAQTHPDRLATMGVFHGVKAADPQNCRVLELGCGTGANLAAMAYSLPSSEFVGIDLSQVHIEQARKMQSDVGLKNTTFVRGDVADFDAAAFGTFDFIVAHGLFSWVPNFVRSKVLEVYSKGLTKNGIGYISFNAYPGCFIREVTRNLMLFHTASEADPTKKVQIGIDFLEQLTAAVDDDSVYKQLLGAEVEAIKERSTSNINHDDLADFNQPFFFSEFASMLSANNLQYVAESAPYSSNTQKFSKAGQTLIDQYGSDDLLRREQYVDFVRGTRFRSSLLCRSDIALEREVRPTIINEFFIGSDVKPQSSPADVETQERRRYTGSSGTHFELNNPLTVAAIDVLSEISPRSLTLDELLSRIVENEPNANADEIGRMSAYLVQLFQAGFVKFHKFRPVLPAAASERPEASSLARWQISIGSDTVTTLYGTSLEAKDLIFRELLTQLDGTRGRNEIAEAVRNSFSVPPEKRERFEADLPMIIDDGLARFAGLGLLIN